MCNECESIDTTIARYRRLRHQTSDSRTHEAADHLIAGLEKQKLALHFDEKEAG